MRILFLIFLVIKGCICQAQITESPYIDSLISHGTCNCLSAKAAVKFEDFETCVMEALSKDSVAVKLEAERVMGDASNESLYKYGYAISKRILVNMIGECDVFYRLFDTVRKKGLYDMKVDSLKMAVEKEEAKMGDKPSEGYYFAKALLQIRQGKWSDGLGSFEAAIKLNPTNDGYLFFKAFTLEHVGRFDEAIMIYEQLAVKLNVPEYYIFSAIVKRLKKEKG